MKNIPAILCLCLLIGVSGCQSQKPDVVASPDTLTKQIWSLQSIIEEVSNSADEFSVGVYDFQKINRTEEAQRAIDAYYAALDVLTLSISNARTSYAEFMKLMNTTHNGKLAPSTEQFIQAFEQVKIDTSRLIVTASVWDTAVYNITDIMGKCHFQPDLLLW